MQFFQWGLPVVLAMFPEPAAQRNAVRHFPAVEDALNREGLDDVRLKLVAYATVRAETASFLPISERESRLNTLRPVDTSALTSQQLRAIGDVTQALVREYKLDNPFGLYDYRNKGQLGNNAHGDGERYKGRGFIQLTGRANYQTFSQLLKLPQLLDDPDLALEPLIAARILAKFICRAKRDILAALETGDLERVRAIVNGGAHGLARFLEAYERGARLALPRDGPNGVLA